MAFYHAHLYFEVRQFPMVKSILAALGRDPAPLRLHRLHLEPVGPHALPMAEFHFDERDYPLVLVWLRAHHRELSVLIHADTGDDIRDHSQNVIWLGKPLPIDFDFFELVRQQPALALHSR